MVEKQVENLERSLQIQPEAELKAGSLDSHNYIVMYAVALQAAAAGWQVTQSRSHDRAVTFTVSRPLR